MSRTEVEYQVAGVARTVPVRSLSEVEPVIYRMPDWHAATLLVRAASGGVAERVRAVAVRFEPNATVAERPLVDYVRGALAPAAVASRVAWAVGGLGLVLAMVGAFGVFACAVEERRREIGIRLVLGARTGRVTALVARMASRALVWGLAGGFLLSLIAVPVLRHLLYGVSPFDPVAYAEVAGIPAVATGLAAWLPVRRAIAVDPASTLRSE